MDFEKSKNVKISIAQIEEIAGYIMEGLHLAYYDFDGEYIDLYYMNENGEKQKRICLKYIDSK